MFENLILQQAVDFFSWSTIPIILAIILVVWKASRDYGTLQNDIKVLRADHNKDILNAHDQLKNLGIEKTQDKSDVNARIVQIQKEILERVNEARLERKEEIAKASEGLANRFIDLQKELDGIRSDVKDANTRVTVVATKVDAHDEEQRKLHDRINSNLTFLTNWNQRIEDRIKESENKADKWISDAKKDLISMFHEHNNAK